MSRSSLWHPGLRLRILAPAVLVAIPAIAMLIFVGIDRRASAEREVADRAQRLARLARVDQERLIEGTRQLLVAISQGQDMRDANLAGCEVYLQHLVSQFGRTYSNLSATDLDGAVVCSGVRETRASSLGDRAYFRRAVESRNFAVGDYIIGRLTGVPTLPFAFPILDGEGRVRGAAFASVDLRKLNEDLIDDDWPADARLIVTDRNDTIVAAYPDWEGWIGKSLKDDPVTASIGTAAEGTFEDAGAGQPMVVAYSRVTKPIDAGLTARVLLSKDVAMAAANRTTYEGFVAFALVAMLVVIGVKATSERLILEPIAQLTKASRSLAAGNLAARAGSSTTVPELNELGKDFDDMAATLEEREFARLRVEMERKDLEQQYHHAQKMDAVGRLAGGIAHDFNNMLTAILGYCELLLEDPTMNEVHRSDVREIEKAGRTAAALTRQLLAFSRREIVEPVVLDLNEVVSGMDKLLHRLVGEHIRMEARLSPHLDPVRADRAHMEQIILNLAVNARDAMPGGGRLVIETANVDMSDGIASVYLAAPQGRYVSISVTDEGGGMSPDVLTHLFEPFFTTKATGKGTGLGLATIYGIVKENSGAIVVTSDVQHGSVFTIYLPRCQDQAPIVAPPELLRRAPHGKATILIVEDDIGIRELTTKVLQRYGHEVLSASGGDEARMLCERHGGAIDLLLSDIVMPGMSGPAVADMLLRTRPAMKVIFMSGYTGDTILRHGVMVHEVPFLQKPFTPERLANKILEVLG